MFFFSFWLISDLPNAIMIGIVSSFITVILSYLLDTYRSNLFQTLAGLSHTIV